MIRRVPAWLWWGLLPVLLGLPFVGRAYFVDDHYHVLMAKGLLDHPLRPYDFVADDAGPDNRGWEKGQPPRMVNPPLHHYLLAAFWKLTGGHLAGMRFLALFLTGLSAIFIHFLARRFVVPPGPATALSVLSPALWLSSYALLIDSTLLVFFLGGLWVWMEGLHRRSSRLLVCAGVLLGLALLTKYTAVFALPLAGHYWGMDRAFRRRPWALAALLIPLGMFGAWSLWNIATYGAVHFTESSKRVVQTFSWVHVLVFLTFFGGVFLLPLSSWVNVFRGGKKGLAATLLLFLGLVLFLFSPWGGFTLFQSTLTAVLAVGGGLFFLEAAQTALRSPYDGDRFLLAWLLLGALQMGAVMQWVAARYYLTILPPVVFLSLRRWETLQKAFPMRRARVQTAWMVALGVMGAALATADVLQAQTQRWVLRDVTADRWLARAPAGYFLGDSFTGMGSGLKQGGWRPAFPSTVFPPGSVVLRSEVVMPPWWFRPRGMVPVAVYEYPSRFPLRVMDNAGAAGFYASAWGSLPFTLTRGPLERYTLFQVVDTSSGGPREPSTPPSRD